jgi:cytochrome c biogenesis protein CcdA
VIPALTEILTRSADVTLSTVFVAGTAVSLSLCAAVRLPIVLAYVAGASNSKRHGAVLSALFTSGLIAGTVLLGLTAAPAEDGLHRVLYANKHLFWILGLGLFVTGVLLSGLINPRLLPVRWQGVAQRLVKAGCPGALLLGCAFGLLQMPACPRCGSALQSLVEVAGGNSGFHQLVLLASFAAGQGLTAFAVGVLTSLAKPDLLLRLRTQMCSIEQRVQLLAGNVLMVLGIYFVIVS